MIALYLIAFTKVTHMRTLLCLQVFNDMVRSETGSAGVMFTLDTESGFDQVVFITSSYGLGETVVQGIGQS